jgi:hypothetical protein
MTNNSNKILGPPEGYITLLDRYTRKHHEDNRVNGKEFQKTPLRPSASGDCTRALYYQLLQFHGFQKFETELHSPELHRLFGLGHFVEDHLLKQFEHLIPGSELQVRYKQQSLDFGALTSKNKPQLAQRFEGSLDAVFWSPDHKCLIDVKSKKDNFSSYHRTKWDDLDEKLFKMSTVHTISHGVYWVENLNGFLDELKDPFFGPNFVQLNGYLNTEFIKQREINHGAIIQYNKNDSRLREVRFKPSNTLHQKTLKRFQGVVDAVDLDNIDLAPREYTLGSIKCKFCKYGKICWGGEDTSQAFWDLSPNKKWPTDTIKMGPDGAQIETLLTALSIQTHVSAAKGETEAEIIRIMLDKKVYKIKSMKGEVWETKRLTNGIVLRRGKL